MDILVKSLSNQKYVIKRTYSIKTQVNQVDLKNMLLEWCRDKTKSYSNVQINNFSTSWSDGLAFCALVDHFIPNSFNYNELSSKNPRRNFELAFNVAKSEANIESLIDVDDMIMMGNRPDWKCVMLYVSSFYNKFK